MKLLQLVLFVGILSTTTSAQWIKQMVNTTASLRGLSVVNEKIVWASGSGGTVIKTTDAGKKWNVMTVPGAEKLDFRDVEAFDADTAYILSIGNGDASRIYKTIDGGATWNLQFANKNEKAFFDAIACWSRTFCLAMSDPVDGRFLILSTVDGGSNWKMDSKHSGVPESGPGEAAFAASGTCILAMPSSAGFLIATGGNAARVFRGTRRTDGGISWRAHETPITHGTSGSGIFSIAMHDAKNGVIVGGNYEKPEEANDNLAFTTDGGVTWKLGTGLTGYRSGVAYVDAKTIIAVGTNGTDLTLDGGATWKKMGDESLNSVSAKGKNAVWSVGPKGNVFHLGTSSAPGKPEIAKIEPSALSQSITRFDLSHTEISSTCSRSASRCSDKKRIAIQTSAIKWNGPHKYVYTVTAGKVVGEGSRVEWDLSGVAPGKYTITAGITIPYADRWGVLGRTETREVVVR